jgi:hypothetical protein
VRSPHLLRSAGGLQTNLIRPHAAVAVSSFVRSEDIHSHHGLLRALNMLCGRYCHATFVIGDQEFASYQQHQQPVS